MNVKSKALRVLYSVLGVLFIADYITYTVLAKKKAAALPAEGVSTELAPSRKFDKTQASARAGISPARALFLILPSIRRAAVGPAPTVPSSPQAGGCPRPAARSAE